MSLINQYFAADHDRLDCLYLAFKNQLASNLTFASQCFSTFTTGLVQHIQWEEEILFPFFEQKTGMTSGPTMVMRSEHEIIKSILTTIATKLAEQNTELAAELAQLEEILAGHNQKEEHILYPMIDERCSELDHAEMFVKMQQM